MLVRDISLRLGRTSSSTRSNTRILVQHSTASSILARNRRRPQSSSHNSTMTSANSTCISSQRQLHLCSNSSSRRTI